MVGNLVLGPVVFRSFEVPERIAFGGKQRLVVHALAGGGRVVDAMGDEDAPVTWSGVFCGPDATDRVRLLERLRRAGKPLALSWEAWRFSVILESFRAEARNPAWIPYQVRACVVLADEAAGVVKTGFSFTLSEAVALGAGERLDARIDAASVALGSGDIVQAIAAAGSLARLVTGRAFAGNIS